VRFSRLSALALLAAIGTPALAPAQTLRPVVPSPSPTKSTIKTDEMDVLGFLWGSLKLLGLEHGVRIAFQEKTRRELPGPFVNDWMRSIRAPKTWEDGDSWLVNYIGHPIHGAAAGFVWMEMDPKSREPQIGLGIDYWKTRARPVIASAIYSLQFEIGPLSEASIGNVGLRPNTVGWVDYVVTPIGGMAILVAEDALDLFFVRWVEARTTNRFYRASLRMIFGPSRVMANVALGRAPWNRSARPLDWRR
jgi:hypothetical protein